MPLYDYALYAYFAFYLDRFKTANCITQPELEIIIAGSF
jgi:hypothetical protein